LFTLIISAILQSLIDIDVNLFLFLNGMYSPFWDVIFYWVTGKTFWIPFYVGILYLTYLKFGSKTLIVLLFFGLLILIGDRTSVELFKNVFERLRPNHNPMLVGLARYVDGCGGAGQFGFVSSHATNSFALAVFTSLILRSKFKFIVAFMLFWAALVSYSRVYVGVHYLADLLGGAMLGTGVAFLVFWILKLVNQKFNLKLVDL
jgi:undecaprenyl-diphosphatase